QPPAFNPIALAGAFPAEDDLPMAGHRLSLYRPAGAGRPIWKTPLGPANLSLGAAAPPYLTVGQRGGDVVLTRRPRTAKNGEPHTLCGATGDLGFVTPPELGRSAAVAAFAPMGTESPGSQIGPGMRNLWRSGNPCALAHPHRQFHFGRQQCRARRAGWIDDRR